MTTLYIANKNYSSWSLRAWLLMTELGIPFEEHLMPFGQPEAWHEFKALGGNGKVPALRHEGELIWDSLAVTEYLAEQYSEVWPSHAANRAWARSACAEMHSGFQALRDSCSMNIGVRIKMKQIPAPLAADCARILALWNEGLERFGGPYLAGDRFTAVDAFFAPVASRFETYGLERDPASAAYIERIKALHGMQRWVEQALQEPWIDLRHEEECLSCGDLVADVRGH